MEPTPSFAPLAAKLVAKAEEIRLADGERDGLAQVMALFMCALLLMLACLCEALDARAAADAARLLVAPAPRGVKAGAIAAPRAARQAPSSAKRAPRLTLAPEIHADAPSGTIQRPTAAKPLLVWSRAPDPIQAVPWRPRRETRLFRQPSCTPISLRYRN